MTRTKAKAKPAAKPQPKAKAKAKPKVKDGPKVKVGPKAKVGPQPKLSPKLPLEWRVLRAAFDLIEENGWAELTLDGVASYGRLDAEDMALLVARKSDILLLLGEQIDQAMMDGGMVEGDVRDCLFDLLMRRYEALQPWRAGVQAIVDDLPSDPGLPLVLAPSFHNSMSLVLEAAGLEASPLRTLGLSMVALATFRTWLHDESADLSATMAAVDKRLAQLVEVAGMLGALA